jgi:hypothetical protein
MGRVALERVWSTRDNSPSLVSGAVAAGRCQPVTTAEQPPPEGDEQPPQATEDEDDSDAQSSEAADSKE